MPNVWHQPDLALIRRGLVQFFLHNVRLSSAHRSLSPCRAVVLTLQSKSFRVLKGRETFMFFIDLALRPLKTEDSGIVRCHVINPSTRLENCMTSRCWVEELNLTPLFTCFISCDLWIRVRNDRTSIVDPICLFTAQLFVWSTDD